MHISVISIFPQMFDAVREYGICARAMEKGALSLRVWNPRDFTEDRHRAVDARPYGGGAGMLMKPQPLARAIDAAKAENDAPVIYLSPQGERLNQKLLGELAEMEGMILLAGRYEGVDERVVESRVQREISIGDYVLAGGELVAMVLIEGIARLLPGVVGNPQSVEEDSFRGMGGEGEEENLLLDCPHYTRPPIFEGRAVPEVLLSGDHEKIAEWRLMQALGRTKARRPELVAAGKLSAKQLKLLETYQRGYNRVRGEGRG